MREHAYLSAMVGLVRNHVAQHLYAHRPGPSPSVSHKLLHAAPTAAERLIQHLRAASRALGQSRAGLQRRAVRAVELRWNLQVRRCKPDPLAADIMHVGEDRSNRADLAGRFGRQLRIPSPSLKMFDKNLIHALVGRKHPRRCSSEVSLNLTLHFALNLALYLGWSRGHGSLFLGPIILPASRQLVPTHLDLQIISSSRRTGVKLVKGI